MISLEDRADRSGNLGGGGSKSTRRGVIRSPYAFLITQNVMDAPSGANRNLPSKVCLADNNSAKYQPDTTSRPVVCLKTIGSPLL